MDKSQLKSKVFTFSVRGERRELIENFKESLGDYNFSEAIYDGIVKLLEGKKDYSDVEKQFDEYCRVNHLSKDAQLMMLMTDFRVANSTVDVHESITTITIPGLQDG